jgi:methyl-accepting chemotaxis protein
MATDITEALALAGIDENTRAVLRESWPLIREGVPYALRCAFVPAMGRDTGAGGPTREQIDAARDGQTKHWEALFAANFDEDYATSLRRISVTHARVGLDPRWLISGYLTTLTELHSLILATQCSSMMSWAARSRLERAIRAIDQAVLFDLQLCLSAYTTEVKASVRAQMAAETPQPTSSGLLVEAIMPADADARRAANQLFVAGQRRTFRAAAARDSERDDDTVTSLRVLEKAVA